MKTQIQLTIAIIILLVASSCKKNQSIDKLTKNNTQKDTLNIGNLALGDKDKNILEFIKGKNEYLALTDTIKMPNLIKPYNKEILLFLYQNKMDKFSYYYPNKVYEIKNGILKISLYHYNSFKIIYEAKVKEKKEVDKMAWIGNISGKDGTLTIDTKKKKIISFIGWK